MSALKRIALITLAQLLVVAVSSTNVRAQAAPEEFRLTVGRSVVLDYPEDIGRISTSNPEVIDYVPVSAREILIHARGNGVATVVVWAKSGQRNFYNFTVEQNLEQFRKLLRDTFPDETMQLQGTRDSVTVTGMVSSPQVAERVVALLNGAAKTVVNNLHVRPLPVDKQIMLKVRFAELNRNTSESLGLNLISTGAGNTLGRTTTGQFAAPSPNELRGVIGGPIQGTSSNLNITDALNIFAFRPDLNLGAFIRDLSVKGVLQILAEPNLVTSNGKEASFLVGGEFPVPVLQGGANAGAVTIQFREFGIRLKFTPTMTANSTLRMHVQPEVSTIDLANSVTVSGFRIPALATRRIESNIELGFGQSFIIGGLLDDRATETLYRMPGLSSIPILGALFKSRDQTKAKTELIVVVTPDVIEPLSPADPKLSPQLPLPMFDPAMLPKVPPAPGPAAAKPAASKKGPARQSAKK